MAFLVLQNGLVGYVKSTNDRTIEVQPLQTTCITLSGLMWKVKDVETAVTEPTNHVSNKIGVCPRVVSLIASCKTQRVQVRIFNISAKTLSIPLKSTLCELQEVTLLRHTDLKTSDNDQLVAINSQLAEEQNRKTCLPAGIDLDNAKLSEEEKGKATEVLAKWDRIFFKGAYRHRQN